MDPLPPAGTGPERPPRDLPSRARTRRSLCLLLLTCAVVAALLVGALVQGLRPDGDLSAFTAAAESLRSAPAVRVVSSSADSTETDLRVAATGEVLGSLRTGTASYDLFRVDGRSYLRSPTGTVPGAGSVGADDRLRAEKLAHRWVAVDRTDQDVPGPGDLGALVASALRWPRLTTVERDGPTIAGVATQVARTPSGSMYVSREQPYRVLRVEPTAAAGSLTSELSLAQPTPPEGEGTKRIDLTEFDPARAARFYTELGDRVQELADAADATLEIRPAGAPTVACGAAGCTVGVTVTAAVQSSATVRTAAAVADLSATITLDGTPVPGCSRQVSLPIDTPTTLSCSAGEAAPFVAEAVDRARRAASATAPPGGSVEVVVHIGGACVVVVRAEVSLESARRSLDEHRAALPGTASATPAPGAGSAPALVRPTGSPDPTAVPSGAPARIRAQDDAETRRSLQRQNESAVILARAGYQVEQLPKAPSGKSPDFRIDGEIFDNYAPTTARVRNLASGIEEKVVTEQADRIVLNLADSPLTVDDIRTQLHAYPIAGLRQVIAIDRQQRIITLYP